MSKLFNIVNEGINSNDFNEAEQKLFGIEGININSEEYFKIIISSFIKKKEHIIRRENKNIIFDLNNYNDIWSIVFLGEYIKENNILYKEYNDLLIEIKIENLEKEINNTIKEHRQVNNNQEKALIDQEHKLIDQKISVLKDELKILRDQMKNYKSLIDTFNNIDWVKLENTNEETEKLEAVKTLKQAINIIHKLRNSIQHGKTTNNNNIKIDDDIFKISIPIEYLDGFNKERIIAQEEDKVIVERTNLIASPLLESLGYDVKNVASFFYNVNPEYLSFLLEKVDYNYDELYKLKHFIFVYKKQIKFLFSNGLTLKNINKLSKYAICNSKAVIELYKEGIDIYKLYDVAFSYPKSIIKLYKEGIDIYEKLPSILFSNPERIIKGREKTFDSSKIFNILAFPESVESIIELYKKGINIYNLTYKAFVYTKATLELNEEGINIYELPEYAFSNPESIIKLHKKGIDIYKLQNKAIEFSDETIKLNENGINIYNISDYVFDNSDSVLKIYEEGINIYKLPDSAFDNPNETIKMYKKGIDIYTLPNIAFDNYKEFLELQKSGIDIYKLNPLAFYHHKAIIKLYEEGIDIYNLPDSVFDNLESIIKLIENGISTSNLKYYAYKYPEVTIKLHEEGINIYKLPEYAFYHPDITTELNDRGFDIYRLPNSAFISYLSTKELYENGIDTYKLPDYAFRNLKTTIKLFKEGINVYKSSENIFDNPESAIELNEKGIDIYKLNRLALINPKETIKLYEKGIDIYKLPNNRRFLYTYNAENIAFLLNLVDNNYDRLNEFPIEFFTCDISLIEEMYKTYNLNVARSIFGINNPKLIATLVYCDSVFKRYQKENNDRDIVDFAPMNFIKLGYANTLNYKNNISDKEMDSQTYLDQFMIDYEDNYRSQINVKSNILDKLRNSICHFRFKPVKDSNGKIVEDKIYLYDKFENSDNTNFNMIIDIKDLVAIVRKIEIGLEIKNTNADDEITEESSIHRKR